MYRAIRNALLATLIVQGVILVMLVAPRLGLPVFALLVALTVAWGLESLADGYAIRYHRQRGAWLRPRIWWVRESRQDQQRRLKKARKHALDLVKRQQRGGKQ